MRVGKREIFTDINLIKKKPKLRARRTIMSINISEKPFAHQYDHYAIDAGSYRQRIQDNKNDSTAASGYDTVEISNESRQALENKLADTVRAKQGIEPAGTLTSMSTQRVFEDYEKAVMAEKRDKAKSNNFDRHLDKMTAAYQRMKIQIEEKYAAAGHAPQYYCADDGSIQELTKEKELELLDNAYAKHSELMAGFTESLNDLMDFKPQIQYHRSGNTQKMQTASETSNANKSASKKIAANKGEVRAQAYQILMSAIQKGKPAAGKAPSRAELNQIWDNYA